MTPALKTLAEDIEVFEEESRILNNIMIQQEIMIDTLLDDKFSQFIGDIVEMDGCSIDEIKDFIRETLASLVK